MRRLHCVQCSLSMRIDGGLWHFSTIKFDKSRYRLYQVESTISQHLKNKTKLNKKPKFNAISMFSLKTLNLINILNIFYWLQTLNIIIQESQNLWNLCTLISYIIYVVRELQFKTLFCIRLRLWKKPLSFRETRELFWLLKRHNFSLKKK